MSERGLATLSGSDSDVRREVERFLAHEKAAISSIVQRSNCIQNRPTCVSVLGSGRIASNRFWALGCGRVYAAEDTNLRRRVALKVLPGAFVHDPEHLARFRREAEVLAQVNHPNIAQIYGAEENALVMELWTVRAPKARCLSKMPGRSPSKSPTCLTTRTNEASFIAI